MTDISISGFLKQKDDECQIHNCNPHYLLPFLKLVYSIGSPGHRVAVSVSPHPLESSPIVETKKKKKKSQLHTASVYVYTSLPWPK